MDHPEEVWYQNLFLPTFSQEWPQQTKPKKGQFMNFSQGHSGTKVQCESCLFFFRKTPEFTKMGKIHELFVLALSLVGLPATPDKLRVVLGPPRWFRAGPISSCEATSGKLSWPRLLVQRTLAIRIAKKTLASDSAIIIARFRPSKPRRGLIKEPFSANIPNWEEVTWEEPVTGHSQKNSHPHTLAVWAPKYTLTYTPNPLPKPKLGRVKSTPDPDTFEKYRDTPPISIAILLQKYALFSAESSIYAANLYHDTAPIYIAALLQKY